MAVTLFTGRPGSGKSYRVVYRMLEECNKYFIFHNVDGLNENFFADGRFIRRWDTIPGFLSLAKQKELSAYCEDQFKRPMLVVIDEANLVGFSNRNQLLLDWISYHRHLGQDIYLVSQSAYSIHRDYVDRCQFEVRAKRGIATKMFIYSYIVGDESFKTDRLPIKKSVFAAYQSFKIAGQKPPHSPILYYVVGLVAFSVCMGAYQVVWGLPHLFGRAGGVVKEAKVVGPNTSLPPSGYTYVPQISKVKPSIAPLTTYSLSSLVGTQVSVQDVKTGTVCALSSLMDYTFVDYSGGRCVVKDTEGITHIISRRKVNVKSLPSNPDSNLTVESNGAGTAPKIVDKKGG